MPQSISVYTSVNVFVVDPSSAHIFVFVDIIALDYSTQLRTETHATCTLYISQAAGVQFVLFNPLIGEGAVVARAFRHHRKVLVTESVIALAVTF